MGSSWLVFSKKLRCFSEDCRAEVIVDYKNQVRITPKAALAKIELIK